MTGNWTTFDKENILKRIQEKNKGRLRLGVSYLDDVFSGIEKNDLILLSAFSGIGKTQLASHIAASNAEKGVKIHYFALEAEMQEIQMRTAYRFAAKECFKNLQRPKFQVRYKLYSKGIIDQRFDEFARFGEEKCANLYKDNFKIFYRRSNNFGIKEFINQIENIDAETQLIIVDHLHYFDYDIGNEYRNISNIIKKIRDVNLEYEIPIILVTQLNRPDRKIKRIVPDLDDIHGSSNLGKICTKAVFLSANKELITTNRVSPTFIRVAKFREEMSVTNYVGLIDYDLETNEYVKKYNLGRLKNFDSEYELLSSNDWPYWAENAKEF